MAAKNDWILQLRHGSQILRSRSMVKYHFVNNLHTLAMLYFLQNKIQQMHFRLINETLKSQILWHFTSGGDKDIIMTHIFNDILNYMFSITDLYIIQLLFEWMNDKSLNIFKVDDGKYFFCDLINVCWELSKKNFKKGNFFKRILEFSYELVSFCWSQR